MRELNPVLLRYVGDADIYVTEVPGIEILAEGVDPRALVLLDGLMHPDRDDNDGRPCQRIFVYALNVIRLAGDVDAIGQEITLALEREITATFLEAEQAERGDRELN